MLTWILTAGAVLCLLYFVVIMFYSGLGTASAVLWLLFAVALELTALSIYVWRNQPQRVALRLPVTLTTLCVAGVVIMLIVQILIFARVPSVAENDLDYLIVLGCQTKGDQPGRTLALRLEKAAEYARQNPETMLVLSGGQGDREDEPEAVVMQRYLAERGVPTERMLMETQSKSTAENLAYSRLLIEVDRQGTGGGQVGILTSNFHLFRAMMIAEKVGFENVGGIAAESDRVLFLHYAFRDGLALLKDRLAGNL
ncbi:MAG: YdcF family protein [Clostridiales bacterium]|nr:YdcF family protein [Clostridiales bacterium]